MIRKSILRKEPGVVHSFRKKLNHSNIIKLFSRPFNNVEISSFWAQGGVIAAEHALT